MGLLEVTKDIAIFRLVTILSFGRRTDRTCDSHPSEVIIFQIFSPPLHTIGTSLELILISDTSIDNTRHIHTLEIKLISDTSTNPPL